MRRIGGLGVREMGVGRGFLLPVRALGHWSVPNLYSLV